jgi:hypothetical protein
MIGLISSLCVAMAIGQVQEGMIIKRDKVLAAQGKVETLANPIRLYPVAKSTGLILEELVEFPGVPKFRLHFTVVRLAQNPRWSLKVIEHAQGREWYFNPVTNEETTFWSDEILGSKATVHIESKDPDSNIRIIIDRVAKSGSEVKEQVYLHTPPNLLPFSSVTEADIKTWGKSIARMRFINEEDGLENFCTGFLVSKDLFLSNEHCAKKNELQSTYLDFDYDRENQKPESYELEELLASSKELDFALYKLKKVPNRPFLPLRVGAAISSDKQSLIVIQHPGGKAKQVVYEDCKVAGALIPGVKVIGLPVRKTDFGHLCDSETGSSGSPVQDRQSGQVVGLHHLGLPPSGTELINRAVRIEFIVDFLKQKSKMPEPKKTRVLQELGIQ